MLQPDDRSVTVDMRDSAYRISPELTANPCMEIPAELAAYLPIAEAAATANLHKALAVNGPLIQSLTKQLANTMSAQVPAKNRPVRIRHLASQWSQALTPFTACSSGCSHCCNQDTVLPQSEALLISRKIGLPMATPATALELGTINARIVFLGQPCTFLKEGACSIYEHRPLVCRTLISMDSTDTLCRIVPGVPLPVPYANTQMLQAAFAQAHQDEPWADIREWFPPRGESIGPKPT